jgi:hypothetical protein
MNTLTTRRALVASAAALPALALPVSRPSSAAGVSDDTLTRIQEHRAYSLKLEEICQRMGLLEETVPEDRRTHWSISDRGTDVGKNDDPRWTAVQSEYWAAADQHDIIAWSFVDRPPTSVAGCVALLGYATEFEAEGAEWPDCIHHFSDDGRYLGLTTKNWQSSMMAALIPELAKLGVQS